MNKISVPSDSDPGVTYDIKRFRTGWSCTCPAWKFQKKPVHQRTCKHIQAYLKSSPLEGRPVQVIKGEPPRGSPKSKGETTVPKPSRSGSWVPEMKLFSLSKPSATPPSLRIRDQLDTVPEGWYVSEKLNGFWVRWVDGHFYTKKGHTQLPDPQGWARALKPYSDRQFDGELVYIPPQGRPRSGIPSTSDFHEPYRHQNSDSEAYWLPRKTRSFIRVDQPFLADQKSALALARDGGEWDPNVRVVLHDTFKVDPNTGTVIPETFEERVKILKKVSRVIPVAAQIKFDSRPELLRFVKRLVDGNREGIVIKNPQGTYQPGSRLRSVALKWKPIRHFEARVIKTATGKKGVRTIATVSAKWFNTFTNRFEIWKGNMVAPHGVKVGDLVTVAHAGIQENGHPDLPQIYVKP